MNRHIITVFARRRHFFHTVKIISVLILQFQNTIKWLTRVPIYSRRVSRIEWLEFKPPVNFQALTFWGLCFLNWKADLLILTRKPSQLLLQLGEPWYSSIWHYSFYLILALSLARIIYKAYRRIQEEKRIS
jgi:hypothetical protein